MIFNNVAELFDSIEQTRAQIYNHAEGLNEEQSRFRPSEQAWSVAEIAEHLSMIESLLMKLVKNLVQQGEASTSLIDESASFAPISIEHIAGQLDGKSQAPDNLRPTGNVSLKESIGNLRRRRASLLALKPSLESRDYTPVVYTNEQLGALNPYQWLAFMGSHEEKHLSQIVALVSSEGFPARAASA